MQPNIIRSLSDLSTLSIDIFDSRFDLPKTQVIALLYLSLADTIVQHHENIDNRGHFRNF